MQGGDNHSVLVEILLHEGKAEDAWREAGVIGCSDSLWLRLAADREKEHPEDAAPLYLKYAEAGVAATSNSRYEESVDLLAQAAAVMKRLDAARSLCATWKRCDRNTRSSSTSSSCWSRNGSRCTSRSYADSRSSLGSHGAHFTSL
jgi:hypothetical protein